MKAYKATFIKKDGSLREMQFVRVEDIPDEYLGSIITGTGSAKKLSEGMELVYDLETDNFRYFNWNTLQGSVQEFEIEENLFNV